jgi:hypothetical protein
VYAIRIKNELLALKCFGVHICMACDDKAIFHGQIYQHFEVLLCIPFGEAKVPPTLMI